MAADVGSPNCKHGMRAVFCSLCNPLARSKPSRKPENRKTTTVYGEEALVTGVLKDQGYVVVSSNVGRDHHSFDQLGPSTKFVHINGDPKLWVIEKILTEAPNVRNIQVTPSSMHKLHSSHLQLCAERNVAIVKGYSNPNLAWEGEGTRSPFYRTQRNFFVGLQGEQKALWDELLTLGFEAAQITSRYFCLGGEPFLAQRLIALEYGLQEGAVLVSQRVNAVIFYLDPTFQTGEGSIARASAIRGRVTRLRALLQSAESADQLRRSLTEKLGLAQLPERLPLARLDAFEAVVRASRDPDKLAKFESTKPKSWKAVSLRFGLSSGKYQTLLQVGDELTFTPERIRQFEEWVLDQLGISD